MQNSEDIVGLLNELDSLQEETDRSSFGIPATQGEIEHYEDNKEEILRILHIVMPHILSQQEKLKIAEEAMREADKIYKRNGESSNEFFERMAAHFYKDSGFLAPGKDDPFGPDQEVRQKAFDDWINARLISNALSRIRSSPTN